MTHKELLKLAEYLAEFAADPLGFVRACFPWGEGDLANRKIEQWQIDLLTDIRDGLKTPDEAIRTATASGHGIGKAHANDLIIDTPQGRRLWGDIIPGDYVFGADGKPTKVIACRKYETIPFYRVTFDDDSYCDVSSGHLWQIRGRQERRNNKDGWRVMSTIDLLNAGVKRANGTSAARQWEIPMQGAAEYEEMPLPVPPYILGVWLGDGSKNKPAYTKPDKEIKEKIEDLGYEGTQSQTGYSNYIKGIIAEFQKIGVFSQNSPARSIPMMYLQTSIENRRELLRGLMDTDGEVNKSHSLIYSTTSKELAENVVWLVRSLGGKAQLQPTAKKGWYYSPNGEKVQGRDCWRVTMYLPFNPFSVEHKKARYKADIQHRYKCRWIDKIEYIGDKAGQCITVENENGLYLANDFIVTHNSAFVSWLILWAISTKPNTRGVITANTDGQLKSKTMPELQKWYSRFIGKELFVCTATAIFRRRTTTAGPPGRVS